MAKFFLSVLFFSLPLLVLPDKILKTFTIFPVLPLGPESLAFGLTGDGPYTGVCDGRILKYEGPRVGFVDFAYVSPNRTKEKCDGTTHPDLGPLCGRPLGLAFNQRTKDLYIADAFHGLCKVGPKGGLAEQVLTSAGGLPLKWLDGIDVDQNTEIVYFTDVSKVYTMREITKHISTGDSTGRLIAYNPKNHEAKVLMSGLKGAGGAAASKDGSFVLVSEITGNRIQKYWLKGPKANKAELFLSVPGPTNMRRTLSGDFWVGSNDKVTQPVPFTTPRGVRFSESGAIQETLTLTGIYNNSTINEVQEFAGSYYVGSVVLPFAASCKV